jgi:hypothetical protein
MTIRSPETGIASLDAIAAPTIDTKLPTYSPRRLSESHSRRPREAPWPSVPDRLVHAVTSGRGAPTTPQTPTTSQTPLPPARPSSGLTEAIPQNP